MTGIHNFSGWGEYKQHFLKLVHQRGFVNSVALFPVIFFPINH